MPDFQDGIVSGSYTTTTAGGLVFRVQYPEHVSEESKSIESQKVNVKPVPHRVRPEAFFKFINAKMEKVDRDIVRRRLLLLKQSLRDAEFIDQQGLIEAYTVEIAIAAQRLMLEQYGFVRFVRKDYVEKFRKRVSEKERENFKILYFEELQNFPRPIPRENAEIIRKCKDLKLFDKYWVLYLDYTEEGKVETNRDKIQKKDPIVFGTLRFDDTYLYVVTDWVDSLCYLTFNEILEDMSVHAEAEEEVDLERFLEKELPRLEQNIRMRQERLAKTNVSNYRGLMEEETKSYGARAKKWWRNFLKRWE